MPGSCEWPGTLGGAGPGGFRGPGRRRRPAGGSGRQVPGPPRERGASLTIAAPRGRSPTVFSRLAPGGRGIERPRAARGRVSVRAASGVGILQAPSRESPFQSPTLACSSSPGPLKVSIPPKSLWRPDPGAPTRPPSPDSSRASAFPSICPQGERGVRRSLRTTDSGQRQSRRQCLAPRPAPWHRLGRWVPAPDPWGSASGFK